MTFQPYMIVVLTLLACVAVGLRSKSWLNPVSLMILWWGTWVWIATFKLTGIFPPTVQVQLMVLTMIGGFMVGGLLPKRFVLQTDAPVPDTLELHFDRVSKWIALIAGLMVVPAFIRGLIGMNVLKEAYKSMAFGTPETPGYIFRSNAVESLYFLISPPLVLLLLIFGIAIYFQNGRGRVLAWALVLTLMDSIMRFSRVNIYMSCILIFAAGLIYVAAPGTTWRRLKEISVRLGTLSAVLAVLTSIVVGIGVIRNDRVIRELKEQFDIYVIDYHTMGFSFIDSDLENPKSDINTKLTYGRLTFGGLESLATIVIRRFDHRYYSPALENAVKFSANRLAGFRRDNATNVPKLYNSYYTIVYTFYSDARYWGLFFGGLALGWLTMLAYRSWLQARRLEPLVWTLFFLSIVLLGIFVSPLEITRTWLVAGMVGVLRLKTNATEREGASRA
jgi:oligosaccharide repeat unit polymerase